ncbi:MAG: hypothetical protein KC462_06640, partial [Cyanobacteria bacterium HKST-UBA05]|nr:hypothetical protein [Cyanobacteria bacterium HKST-UBA05]
GLGIFAPMGVETVYNRHYGNRLRAKYGMPSNLNQVRASLFRSPLKWFRQIGVDSPMQLPFEWLDPTFKGRKPPKQLAYIAKGLGINVAKLGNLLKNPGFRRDVMRGKSRIMLIDLGLFAIAGQLTFWGKNWMTERLAHRKGFSGIFKYTSADYTKQAAQHYEQQKKDRIAASIVVGVLGALGLPLLVNRVVQSPAKTGLVKSLKRLMPAFNYSNAIFMSKWVLLWNLFANYLTPEFLSCRDSNEVRETAWKEGVASALYFGGDDVFAGLGAAWITRNASGHVKKQLAKIPLLKPRRQWLLNGKLPLAQSLMRVYQETGANPKHPLYRLARNNAWWSLVITVALLGFITPLLNNWYTKQKIMSEITPQKPTDPRINPTTRPRHATRSGYGHPPPLPAWPLETPSRRVGLALTEANRTGF